MAGILTESIRRMVMGTDVVPSPGARNAEVVAVCARKGGVGKTTTAVNFAAGLALFHGRRVLLVDMDAQGHCGTALHAELRGVATDTLSSVLLGKRRDVKEIALPTGIPGLFVTPSDKELGATEGVMSGRIGKETLLRQALRLARAAFDVVVVDCPPNLGTLTVNALMAADHVLVPCDMSILALEGVDDIFDTLETLEDALGHRPSVLGVLRTRVDARNQKVNDEVTTSLRRRHGRHLLETTVPVNTTLSQSQSAGTTVFRHDPSCRGAEAYRTLLEEIGPLLGLAGAGASTRA